MESSAAVRFNADAQAFTPIHSPVPAEVTRHSNDALPSTSSSMGAHSSAIRGHGGAGRHGRGRGRGGAHISASNEGRLAHEVADTVAADASLPHGASTHEADAGRGGRSGPRGRGRGRGRANVSATHEAGDSSAIAPATSTGDHVEQSEQSHAAAAHVDTNVRGRGGRGRRRGRNEHAIAHTADSAVISPDSDAKAANNSNTTANRTTSASGSEAVNDFLKAFSEVMGAKLGEGRSKAADTRTPSHTTANNTSTTTNVTTTTTAPRSSAGHHGKATNVTMKPAEPAAMRALLSCNPGASHAEMLAAELRDETYDCTICFECIERRAPIWSCDTCYRVFHLGCIKTWREKSAGAGEAWRCPGCTTATTVAPIDKCFCGKMRHPDADPFITPHSCGAICGRGRGNGCPHRCEAPCHPGACAPCSALGPVRHCGCGRRGVRGRCGQYNANSEVASCGEVCGKQLGCGVKAHRCGRVCHGGPCPPCEHVVLQYCYCGRCKHSMGCGSGSRQPRSKYLKLADSSSLAPCVEVTMPISHSVNRFAAPLISPSAGGAARKFRSPSPASGALKEHSRSVDSDGTDSESERFASKSTSLPVAYPIQVGLYTGVQAQTAGGADSTEADLLALLAASGEAALAEQVDTADAAARVQPQVQAVLANMHVMRTGLPVVREVSDSASASEFTPEFAGKEEVDLLQRALQLNELKVGAYPSYEALHSASKPPLPSFGYFTCGAVCGAWLDCGLHRCQEACHAGDCRGCPFLPSRLESCACGKTRIIDMEYAAPRRTCLDPVPTCSLPCGKVRTCGHPCSSPCHTGACPPCTSEVRIHCRCKESTYVLPCIEVYECAAAGGNLHAWARKRGRRSYDEEDTEEVEPNNTGIQLTAEELMAYPLPVIQELLRCGRVCGKKLACGRHKCTRQCCPHLQRVAETEARETAQAAHLAASIRDRLAGAGTRNAASASLSSTAASDPAAKSSNNLAEEAGLVVPTDLEPEGQGPGHLCLRPCGRLLGCGKHHCENVCHAGPCGPCGYVSFEALACTCGRTVVEPPVPCGTRMPTCSHPCPVLRDCGHPQAAWHTCHTGPCPPCTHPTDKLCAGGHEVRHNIPCHIKEVTCTRKCGKALPCGHHHCDKPCHAGNCVDDDIMLAATQGSKKLHADAHVYATKVAEAAENAKSRNIGSSRTSVGSWQSSDADVTPNQVYERAVADFLRRNASVAHVSCGKICDRPRMLCPHTCSEVCHPQVDCPQVQCMRRLTISCACNRLCASVPCLHGLGLPGSELEEELRTRRVPCDAVCLSAERARAFGLASGAIAGAAGVAVDGKFGNCPYPDTLLTFASDNMSLAEGVEQRIRELISDPMKAFVDLPVMTTSQRAFTHQLADVYGLRNEAIGVEPKRFIRLTIPAPSEPPKPVASLGEGESIGRQLTPGVIIMPSLTLMEAVQFYRQKVEKVSKAGGTPKSTFVPHPMEPTVAALNPAVIGKSLLLFGVKRSARESDIRHALGGGLILFRRLDDTHIVATFESAGKAVRALDAVMAAEIRGAVLPFKARYWGVGVDQVMAGSGAPTTPSSVPISSSTKVSSGSGWAAVVSSKPTPAPVAPAPPPAPVNRFSALGVEDGTFSTFPIARPRMPDVNPDAW